MTPLGDLSASLRQWWSSGQDRHQLWFPSVTDGALLSPICDSIPEPFIPSNTKFTFSGEINHNVHKLLLLNWLLQLFYTKVWQLWEKESHSPYLFLCFSFIVLCMHWFPFPPCFYFQCAVCFWSHCRIVTIKLNNTVDVKAVFVCCESELTQNEKRFLPSPAWGLIIFPLLSSPDGGKLI